ncbi:MAG: outer membrane beta-barrel protein [Sphingobium sp.]
MNYTRSLFAAVAAAIAVPASAQDFTGPRAEVTVGFDELRFNLEDYGETGRTKRADLAVGIAAGYDAELSPGLIGGVEVGANFSGADYSFGDATTGGSLHARRDLTLAGRLGTKVSNNTLLYGKVGYSNFRVRSEDIAEGVTTSNLKNLDGVLLGVGAEVAISPTTYLKSEYRYTNYQDGFVRNDVLTGIGIRF